MISSESIDKDKLDEYPNVIAFMNKPIDLGKLKAMHKANGYID